MSQLILYWGFISSIFRDVADITHRNAPNSKYFNERDNENDAACECSVYKTLGDDLEGLL